MLIGLFNNETLIHVEDFLLKISFLYIISLFSFSFYRLRIRHDADNKIFEVDFDLRFQDLSEEVLKDHPVPIPICNEEFSLEGK